MFLLIPNFSIWSVISKLNLHSTMFLLIQPFLCPQESVRLYLHSTIVECKFDMILFTKLDRWELIETLWNVNYTQYFLFSW